MVMTKAAVRKRFPKQFYPTSNPEPWPPSHHLHQRQIRDSWKSLTSMTSPIHLVTWLEGERQEIKRKKLFSSQPPVQYFIFHQGVGVYIHCSIYLHSQCSSFTIITHTTPFQLRHNSEGLVFISFKIASFQAL